MIIKNKRTGAFYLSRTIDIDENRYAYVDYENQQYNDDSFILARDEWEESDTNTLLGTLNQDAIIKYLEEKGYTITKKNKL